MKNIYRKLLEGLDHCYFDVINSYTCDVDIIDRVDTNVYYSDKYDTGATKLVLFPKAELNLDIVVKIPFTHSEDKEWGPDEDDNWKPGEYYPLCGAFYGDGWDYCKAETLYYEHAVEEGIEFAFLKTELIGYSDDFHPIYIQKKAEMLESREESHKKDWTECQLASNFCTSNHLDCFSDYWVADFLNCYGEEAYKKLHDFLADFHIWDMHSGNLGYYNGKPVIVDYGGYHE